MGQSLDIVAVFKNTASLLAQNALAVLGIAVFVFAPYILLLMITGANTDLGQIERNMEEMKYMQPNRQMSDQEAMNLLMRLFGPLLHLVGGFVAAQLSLSLVMLPLVAGAFSFLASRKLSNQRVTAGEALNASFFRIVPLIVTALLIQLGIVLGSMLCVIPGIILMCMYAVAIPVVVVEKKGVFEALGRSGTLTEGNRGMVFVVLLLLSFLAVVKGQVVSLDRLGNLNFMIVLYGLVDAAWLTVCAMAVAAMYCELRKLEGGGSAA